MILVTGGAGFIGANFIHDWFAHEATPIVNLDKLTYAGNLNNLSTLTQNVDYHFVHGDINDGALVKQLLEQYQPRAVVHFAAESHVDRSIYGPADFVQTNINGTFTLLEMVRQYWQQLAPAVRDSFRFVQVSTDEVYGSLAADALPFEETTPYAPNSPYAASKAAADHLVRAYFHTYGLPTIISNCSNNYGPYQFPEKFIPLLITNALQGKSLPIYGDGLQIRDWLYVTDHCAALRLILAKGRLGESYNIGGWNEQTNLAVVNALCETLAKLRPTANFEYTSLISHVADRPGHDRRYAINAQKMARELGWKPKETFSSGLRKTVRWYLDNLAWINAVQSGEYQQWLTKNYLQRD